MRRGNFSSVFLVLTFVVMLAAPVVTMAAGIDLYNSTSSVYLTKASPAVLTTAQDNIIKKNTALEDNVAKIQTAAANSQPMLAVLGANYIIDDYSMETNMAFNDAFRVDVAGMMVSSFRVQRLLVFTFVADGYNHSCIHREAILSLA